MRILHTEASGGWGGQELRILDEAAGLARRGHEVWLACPEHTRIYREAPIRGLPVAPLPIGKKRLRGLAALTAWLARQHFDVINTHSSTDSWLAALAVRLAGGRTPLVRTRHISTPVAGNASTRWLYARAAAHVVTTGERLRAQLIAETGVAPNRVSSVPTGVDLARFTPGDRVRARAALGLEPDAFWIGIVATLRDWKGHLHLLDAVARLPGVRLAVVGDGPHRPAIEARSAALGLGGRVHMAGEQRDVRPWLHAVDAFALPSTGNEGVPQALLQALACGLPAVATPVGSVVEAIIPDHTGLIVPVGDAPALARALDRLRGDAGLRARLGGAGLEHVRANLGSEVMLTRMEEVFQRVTARGRSL